MKPAPTDPTGSLRTGPGRSRFRFVLPSSLSAGARICAPELEAWLSGALGRPVEVGFAEDYRALSTELLSDRADAGWAPPYVCARLEAMGARVLARAHRRGGSTYRAALVCRAESPLQLSQLGGTTAAWVDRDSVGGYLLAAAFLKLKKLDPERTFRTELFAGSYSAAVELLLSGKADVTSVYAPPGPAHSGPSGIDEIVPGRKSHVAVVAYTDESPNDGVALGMSQSVEATELLGRALTTLHTTTSGKRLLAALFNAERFELAPRLSYRALYRV